MQKDYQIRLIGTCPGIESTPTGSSYLEEVEKVTSWAEEDGWDGLLIFTDNQQADPWLVAQLVLQSTVRLRPLVAVQPAYMHPFTAAKMIASLVTIHGRAVDINLVAGAFMRDLPSLNAWLPHDDRYDRVAEYATIMDGLISNSTPLTFKGDHYEVKNLQLSPRIDETFKPKYTISGSSLPGRTIARQIGATAIQYPKPAWEYSKTDFDPILQHGVRLGIIVRETAASAWAAAVATFPPDPVGAKVQEYVAKTSDAEWLRKLSHGVEVPTDSTYWLGPFQNAQKSCPYLVGDFEKVSAEIAAYTSLGIKTFLIEQPFDAEDSKRIAEVFRQATVLAGVN